MKMLSNIKLKWLMALGAVMLIATACDELTDEYNGCGSSGDNTPITVTVTGDLTPTPNDPSIVGREATVTFNHFPNTLDQFKTVLPTLKETPQGAVVAQLMAMELYRRNRKQGEKAFPLCNVTTNVGSIMSRVPDLFGYAGTEDKNYQRQYQVASFLKGASRDNGYNPTEPYTVEIKVSVNGAKYSEDYQADVLYLEVMTSGSDSGERGCEVVNSKKPGEPSGWIVVNCPGFYSQCKAIGYGTTFRGLK